MSDNMKIWGDVCKTDPKATKQYKGVGGFEGTAINATYLTMRATEVFGPIGIGWGYEIVEEKITDGHPIIITDSDNKPHNTGIRSQIHTIRLKLWYMIDGQRGEVEHYGHTPMVYTNKYGIQSEAEPCKKSLTDAMKKCLSMLGFAADIFSGEFDDQSYVDQMKTEFEIKRAENRENTIDAKRGELSDYVRRNLDVLATSNTLGEINGIAKTTLRHLARQAKILELKDIADHGIRAIETRATERKAEISARAAA